MICVGVSRMWSVVLGLLSALGALFKPRRLLLFEIVALRHQLAVYRRSVRRPHLHQADRILWSWLSSHWSELCVPQIPLRRPSNAHHSTGRLISERYEVIANHSLVAPRGASTLRAGVRHVPLRQ